MTTPNEPERSTAELLQSAVQDVRALVREEIEGARAELSATAQRATRGAALLGGAAVLGVLATGTSAALVLRTLDRVLPPPVAALAATLVYGAGAAALSAAGVAELRRAGPLLPRQTLDNVREDLETVAAAATPSG